VPDPRVGRFLADLAPARLLATGRMGPTSVSRDGLPVDHGHVTTILLRML
jgi:hypothetical protein